MNNYNFTMVNAENRTPDFHSHPDSDEVFYIVSGKMKLEFRDRVVEVIDNGLLKLLIFHSKVA